MKHTVLFAMVIGLMMVGCSSPPSESKSGSTPWDWRVPIAFPTPECEPGPEPAEVRLVPDRIDLAPGETATVKLYVTRNGYCGPIDVAIGDLPEGVHAETTSASWPAVVGTVQLRAADELIDEIRHVSVRASTGDEDWFQFTLRTRTASEPNWADEVVGIPETRQMGEPIWVDGNRFVFLDYERTAPDETTPIVQCIELGIGRCADFGMSGSVPLEPREVGQGATSLARAPDGSVIVATPSSDPTRATTWARLTRVGELLPLPALASAATDVAVVEVAVDSDGRILFLSVPDGWTFPNTLVRLKSDGSLDESFGDGGSVPAVGVNRVVVLPDGRIVLVHPLRFAWLDEGGTPIGAPVTLDDYQNPAEALPDGSVIYGQSIPVTSGSSTERGRVTVVEPTGNVLQHWDLGLQVDPLAFFLDGEEPVVVVNVGGDGLLRVMRLPLDGGEPVTIAERTVGSSAWTAWAVDSSSGSLYILGTRAFRLPDEAVPWVEAFAWHVE